MHNTIFDRAAAAMADSDFLAEVQRCRNDDGRNFTTDTADLGALSTDEIERLIAQGNSAQDWSQIQVADGFDCARVRNSHFIGNIVFGRFSGNHRLDGTCLPSGVYNSTVANSKIGHDAMVRDVRLMANYWVGPNAIVHDCGRVVCVGPTAFGLGIKLSFGVETGGRDVPIYAEIDVSAANMMATSHGRPELRERFLKLVHDYTERATSTRGIIGSNGIVRHTPILENTYLGAFSRVEGATLVTKCILFGGQTEAAVIESGACVSDSVLQWSSRVSTLAIVERAVLTECSGAERHAKVTSSLLGPNTIVGEGEISNSLVGPFVGFHHQALLISALWPEGKGNVAAGAQVGSNHTGRAADQEFCPGEGLFVGLGANIKFPADFRRSPYSIVACGVTTASQTISFPFSLITPATVPAPAGWNEIIPAWVLTDSLYSVFRTEDKFLRRNRARRSNHASGVFRPEIIDAMRDALMRLEGVAEGPAVYAENQITGLGKNILLAKHLKSSIGAYRFFVRYYALSGLLARVQELLSAGELSAVDHIIDHPSTDRWEHQRRILCAALSGHNLCDAIVELADMAERVATMVEQSKLKDEERGCRVFPDYAAVHPATSEDHVVRHVWKVARTIGQQTGELISQLRFANRTRASMGNGESARLALAHQ